MKWFATTTVAVCLTVVIAGGAVGAAPVPGGRIVFESSLPVYPLPDNFQAQRHFSIRFDGRARREIHPPMQWIWSRGVTRVFFARDGSVGAEVWAERADGTRAHRLAVLRGSGRVQSLDVSPDGSQLSIVAGALWVVGSDGSSPHTVFTPASGSPVSSVTWSRDGSRLLLFSDGLWSARADGGGARRLFPATTGIPLRYTSSPDGTAVVVTAGDTWLVSVDGAAPAKVSSDEIEAVEWNRDSTAFALQGVSLGGCGPSSYKCAQWYLHVFSRDGVLLARLGDARAAAWSPDGKQLAFEVGWFADPDGIAVHVARADGSSHRNLSAKLTKSANACWRYPQWVGRTRISFDQTGCDADDYGAGWRSAVVEAATGRLVRSIPGTNATPSPDGKRSAYLSARGSGVGLFVASADGRNPLRLSPKHTQVEELAWSADGRFLAFTMGGEIDGQQLYVVNSRGGHIRQVTRELRRSYIFDLTWSRDGRTLFYDSILETIYGTTLWTVDATGSGPRRLTYGRVSAASPAWSPDGRRIAFTAYREGELAEIRVMNANGSGMRRVVGNLRQPDTSPAWSPDGRRLVFARNIGTTFVLGIVNADGTNARLLKRAHSVYGSPAWSPESNLIVYSDSGTALMAIAPDGTRKHPILKRECPTGDGFTPKCARFGDVAFSPDGSRIAVACNYCDVDTEAGIWVVGANSTGLTLVAAVPGAHPAWSGDGRSIVFTGACGPPPPQGAGQVNQLCMVGADGSNLHALTTWPYGAGPPSWSWR